MNTELCLVAQTLAVFVFGMNESVVVFWNPDSCVTNDKLTGRFRDWEAKSG